MPLIKISLLLTSLYLIESSSVLHYTQNEAFVSSNFKFTIEAVGSTLTNTASSAPSIVVEELAPLSISVSSDLPFVSNQYAVIHAQIRDFVPVRIDSATPLSINIVSSSSTTNPSLIMLGFVFMRTATDGTVSYPTMMLTFKCWQWGCSTNSLKTNPPAVFGGQTFQVQSGGVFPFLVTYPQTTPQQTWVGDIMAISKWLVSGGYVNSYDQICNFFVLPHIWGTGTLNLTLSTNQSDRNTYLRNSIIPVGNYTVVNEAVLWALTSLDFSNMTTSAEASTSISDVVYQFRFLTEDDTTTVKSHCHTVIGYYQGAWRTAWGSYGLPLAVNQKATVLVNFTFAEKDMQQRTMKSACITAFVRGDYDTSVNSFPNTPHQTEVRVCPWWSPELVKPASLINTVSFNGSAYELYNFNETILRETTQANVFLFVARRNTNQIEQTDIFAFVRYLVTRNRIASTDLLAAVSVGFRGYYGNSLLQFQNADFSFNIIDEFAQGMNITVVAPLQCLILEQDDEQQSCVPSTELYQVAMYFLSTPALAITLRLTPITILFDELAYYSYHAASYDRSFQALVDLAWNITNTKWFPAALTLVDSYYHRYVADPATIMDNRAPLLSCLIEKGEDIFFLNMTLDYWLWTVPLNCFFFCLLHLAWRLFNNTFMASFLKPLSSVSYLLKNLICDNVVFMVFRGLIQLRFLVPSLSTAPLALFNICISMLALWLFVCVGVSAPFLSLKWGRSELEGDAEKQHKYLLDCSYCINRICTGAVHASSLSMIVKISCLSAIHVLDLLFTLKYRRCHLPSSLVFVLASKTVKLVLHGFLIAQVVRGDVSESTSSAIYNIGTAYCVATLFLILIVNLVVKFIIEIVSIIKKNRGPSSQAKSLKPKKIIQRAKRVQPQDYGHPALGNICLFNRQILSQPTAPANSQQRRQGPMRLRFHSKQQNILEVRRR